MLNTEVEIKNLGLVTRTQAQNLDLEPENLGPPSLIHDIRLIHSTDLSQAQSLAHNFGLEPPIPIQNTEKMTIGLTLLVLHRV